MSGPRGKALGALPQFLNLQPKRGARRAGSPSSSQRLTRLRHPSLSGPTLPRQGWLQGPLPSTPPADPPIHAPARPPIHSSTWTVHPLICQPIHLSTCLHVHLPTHPPTHSSVNPSVHPPVHLSACPSTTHLFTLPARAACHQYLPAQGSAMSGGEPPSPLTALMAVRLEAQFPLPCGLLREWKRLSDSSPLPSPGLF